MQPDARFARVAAEVGGTVTVRAALGALRLGMATLCLVALVARFVWGLGSATFTPGNFFAYLTVQSNMAFVVVSVITGLIGLRGANDPPWLDTTRACVLSLTVSSGVVFGFLVEQAGARGFRIDVPWSDQVLHFWLPAIALLDWIVAPGRRRALWRTVALVLVFTVGWGLVTLVRGPIVGWYPYFFLDPAQVSGPGEFFLFGGIALTLFGGISSGLVAISRTRPLYERWVEREPRSSAANSDPAIVRPVAPNPRTARVRAALSRLPGRR
ncbi:Pr6Pr family membrane protein [Lacisediminihabitans sp.]|uniref:Pr6Pr family membrane protein n=1 Tax=Lacisediminihabitans sp. TaxID=2787631 RepID=UPI00374DCB3A